MTRTQFKDNARAWRKNAHLQGVGVGLAVIVLSAYFWGRDAVPIVVSAIIGMLYWASGVEKSHRDLYGRFHRDQDDDA